MGAGARPQRTMLKATRSIPSHLCDIEPTRQARTPTIQFLLQSGVASPRELF
jgi:hypothetical protein